MKKIIALLFIVFTILTLFFIYLDYRPVRIIATHQERYSSYILVDNFPVTAKQQINWWLEKKGALLEKYGIPVPDDRGDYMISVWLFGEGYKEMEKYDRLCFDDMPPPVNCIEKDRVMLITLTRDNEVMYWLSSGLYIEKPNGKLYRKDFD